MPKHLFDNFDANPFDEFHCFLCCSRLKAETRTEEHIIPEWLQRKYNLWNKTMVLQNGTRIKYKDLKVPCCRECNNEYLSDLEIRVKSFFERREPIDDESKALLFVWLSKILFFLLYKETQLCFSRQDPTLGNILDTRFVKQFRMLHIMLQAARHEFRFSSQYGSLPFTVLVVPVSTGEEGFEEFDFRTLPLTFSASIRLEGRLILISADGGAQWLELSEHLERIERHTFHPYQCAEIIAKFFYKSYLFQRLPFFVISEEGGVIEVTLVEFDDPDHRSSISYVEIGDFLVLQATKPTKIGNEPLFGTWDNLEFAKILAFHCRIGVENVLAPSNEVYSILYREDGSLLSADEVRKQILHSTK